MSRQLRIAERRGIFQRPDLSQVQEFGLVILMDTDEIQAFVNEQKETANALKFALVANDPMRMPMLFPMFVSKDDANMAVAAAMEADAPFEIVADDEASIEDALKVLAMLNGGGVLDLASLEELSDG